MPETKNPFLYELPKNPFYDNSLECDLVRTLRIRYEKRHDAKHEPNRLNPLKETIQQLKTYRHNRTMNLELHAKLDKALITASKARCFDIPDTPSDLNNARIYWDCYYKLSKETWSNDPVTVHNGTAHQMQLFDLV